MMYCWLRKPCPHHHCFVTVGIISFHDIIILIVGVSMLEAATQSNLCNELLSGSGQLRQPHNNMCPDPDSSRTRMPRVWIRTSGCASRTWCPDPDNAPAWRTWCLDMDKVPAGECPDPVDGVISSPNRRLSRARPSRSSQRYSTRPLRTPPAKRCST